jgi:uncharacterized LabA/DUF88 family protein
MTDEARLALLIDADNCPAAKIEVILDELAKYGVTNVRRAYGNWKSAGLKSWEEVLHEFAIQPIQQFAYTKGKNATDSAMIIDAMDLLYTQKLDGFAIASSDSDFTPLVMRIRANGLKVYGFGEQKTPMPFVNACSKFLYLETLGVQARTEEEAAAASVQKKSTNELKGDARLVTLLRNAVEACLDDDGWAALSAVGSHISNQTSFDHRNYGYRKLSDLIEATGLFDSQRRNTHLYLRDKRSARKTAA